MVENILGPALTNLDDLVNVRSSLSESDITMQDKKGWQLFLKLCTTASKKGNLEQLLQFLLTDEEVAQLEKRVLLVQALLAEETTQREIAKNLQVSISKITRGSNSLKHIDSDLKKFLRSQLNES